MVWFLFVMGLIWVIGGTLMLFAIRVAPTTRWWNSFLARGLFEFPGHVHCHSRALIFVKRVGFLVRTAGKSKRDDRLVV
jgi:hypothetical protein